MELQFRETLGVVKLSLLLFQIGEQSIFPHAGLVEGQLNVNLGDKHWILDTDFKAV